MCFGKNRCREFTNLQAGYARLKSTNDTVLDFNRELKAENMHLKSVNEMLVENADNLGLENERLNNTISRINGDLSRERTVVATLKSDIKEYVFEIKELKSQIKNMRANDQFVVYEQLCSLKNENANLRDELVEAYAEIRRLEGNRKSGSDDFWDHQEFVGHMEKSAVEDIVFRKCKKDGVEYLDARVVRDGLFTRKGLCMTLETFQGFARKCITVLSRIDANTYNKEEIRRAKNCCKAK